MCLRLKISLVCIAVEKFKFCNFVVSLMAVTWIITCTYSQFLAQKTPTCCVSLSSFYNTKIVQCPKCTCGCRDNNTNPGSCVEYVIFICSVLKHPSIVFFLHLTFLFPCCFTTFLQPEFAVFSVSRFKTYQEQLCTPSPVHKSYVPGPNSLACEA